MLKILLIVACTTTLHGTDPVYEKDVDSLLNETRNPILRKEWESEKRNGKWIRLQSFKLNPRHEKIPVEDDGSYNGHQPRSRRNSITNQVNRGIMEIVDETLSIEKQNARQRGQAPKMDPKHLQVKNSGEWTEEDNHWEFDETNPSYKRMEEDSDNDNQKADSGLEEDFEEIVDKEVEEYDAEQVRHDKDEKKQDKNQDSTSNRPKTKIEDIDRGNGGNTKSDKSGKKKTEKPSDFRKKNDEIKRKNSKNEIDKPKRVDSGRMPEHLVIEDEREWTKDDIHWDYNLNNSPDDYEPDTDNTTRSESDINGDLDIDTFDIDGAIDRYNDIDRIDTNPNNSVVIDEEDESADSKDNDDSRDIIDDSDNTDSKDGDDNTNTNDDDDGTDSKENDNDDDDGTENKDYDKSTNDKEDDKNTDGRQDDDNNTESKNDVDSIDGDRTDSKKDGTDNKDDDDGTDSKEDDDDGSDDKDDDDGTDSKEDDHSADSKENDNTENKDDGDNTDIKDDDDGTDSKDDDDGTDSKDDGDNTDTKDDDDGTDSKDDDDGTESKPEIERKSMKKDDDGADNKEDDGNTDIKKDDDDSTDSKDDDSTGSKEDDDSTGSKEDDDSTGSKKDDDSTESKYGDDDNTDNKEDSDRTDSKEDDDNKDSNDDDDGTDNKDDDESTISKEDDDSMNVNDDDNTDSKENSDRLDSKEDDESMNNDEVDDPYYYERTEVPYHNGDSKEKKHKPEIERKNHENDTDEEKPKKYQPEIVRKNHQKKPKPQDKIEVVDEGDHTEVDGVITIYEKEFDIVSKEIPADKEIILKPASGEEIRVKIPLFTSTTISSDTMSFKFHLSHRGFHGIQKWFLNIVKLEKNEFERPTFLNEPKEYALDLKRHQDNPEANEAVTIAEFEPDRVPFTFTAGSGDRYYEFANDRLDSNQYYGVFIVGVVYLSPGKKVYLTTGWVEDAHSPGRPTYFLTKKGVGLTVPIFVLLNIVVAVGLLLLWWLWKRNKLIVPDTSYKFKKIEEKVKKNSNKEKIKKITNTVMPKLFKKHKSKGKSKQLGRSNKPTSSNKEQYDLVSFKPKGQPESQITFNKQDNNQYYDGSWDDESYPQDDTTADYEAADYGEADYGEADYNHDEYDEYGQMVVPKGLTLQRHFVSETELDDTILNMVEEDGYDDSYEYDE